LLAAILALPVFAVPAADPADPYARETPAQHDARMAWWREARFGMFIHWGVYSVPAGTYNGQAVNGLGEWIMSDAKIPMADYQAFAKQFNPVKFNADEWVRVAREAGMKYIVITAKHHDGFANFATTASAWNIVEATPDGRDVLKPLAEACRRQGMKLGFYYSQAQDWNNGGSACSGRWDPAQQRNMDEYIDKVAAPQVRELLSNYGEFPAVLWWDTPCAMSPERAARVAGLLALKPGLIHHDRLGGGFRGDTETPEQRIPAAGFPGRDWETCMTMNNTWGFQSLDGHWKSPTVLIRNLVDIAGKGGNYLLNVGPTSEGLIPDASIARLRAVGAWMKINHESIYATTASPFKRLPWGRCTSRIAAGNSTLYLHVFDWPEGGCLRVPGLNNPVNSARLLATGKVLNATATPGGVLIKVPATAPDDISSTMVLEIQGAPAVTAPVIRQAADGSVQLLAADADLHGSLACENQDGRDNLGYWTNPGDSASWSFVVARAGRFNVEAELGALAAAKFEIISGEQRILGASPATGDYGRFLRTNLDGSLMLAAGRITLTVNPLASGWQPMNLRSLRLIPAGK
jgi:alpha-L-fucosidase